MLVNGVVLLPTYQAIVPVLQLPVNVAVSPSQIALLTFPFTFSSSGAFGIGLTVATRLSLVKLFQTPTLHST